jgi:hypothetical protein
MKRKGGGEKGRREKGRGMGMKREGEGERQREREESVVRQRFSLESAKSIGWTGRLSSSHDVLFCFYLRIHEPSKANQTGVITRLGVGLTAY